MTDLAVSSMVAIDLGGTASLNLNGRVLGVQGDWTAGDIVTTSPVSGGAVMFYGTGVSKIRRTTGKPARFDALTVAKDAGEANGVRLLSDIEVDGAFTVQSSSFVAAGKRIGLGGDLRLQAGYLDVETSTTVIRGSRDQAVTKAGGFTSRTMGPVWVQSTMTVTIPGIEAWVLIATQPAGRLRIESGQTAMIGSLTVNGQSAAARHQLTSSLPDQTAGLTVMAASVQNAYLRGIDASGGPAISASSSIDGGGNTNVSASGSPALKTWSYGGSSPLASVAGNWSPSGAPGAGDTVVFGNTTPSSPCTWDLEVPVTSLSVTGSYASTVTLAADLVVSSTVRLDAGAAAALDLAGNTLFVQGDWLAGPARATSTVAGEEVTFFGAAHSRVQRTSAGMAQLPKVVVRKAADKAAVLASDMEAQKLSVLSGTMTVRGKTQHVLGDLELGTAYLDVEGSTIVLRGSRPQAVRIVGTPSGSNLSGLFVQNPTAVTLAPMGAYVFVATQPGTSLIFPAGQNSAFWTFTVSGQAAGSRIQLLSSSAGQRAQLEIGASESTSFVFARDIELVSLGVNALNSVDGGNNSGFTFGGGAVTKSWSYGGATSSASASGNWSPAGAPGAGDFVVFGAGSSTCLWDLGIGVSSWTMTSGFSGTVKLLADLSVSSGVRIDGGSLDLNGRRVDVRGDWVVGGSAATLSPVAGSTVSFFGAGVSRVGHASGGTARFNHLIARKDVELKLISDVEARGDVRVEAGSHTASGKKQWLRGDLILVSGFVDLTGSTLVFAGAQPQGIMQLGSVGGTPIGGIHVQNASTVTVIGPSGDVFIATTPASTIVLDLVGPTAFQAITLNGQSAATRIKLRTIAPGNAQKLYAQSFSAQFVDVRDVDSGDGVGVVATGSVDRGNNTNWTFPIDGSVTASSFTVTVTSLTARWDSTYPPGVQYTAQLSSGPWPNAHAGNQSSATYNLHAGFTGLHPNTTYYLRVSTPSGAFTTLNSSATYPSYLSGLAVAQVGGSSITVSWTALPGSPPDASSKTALGYILQASVNPDFSGTVYSSRTTSLAQNSLTIVGLDQETTYYLRAGGIARLGGILTDATLSTMTTPGLPAGCDSGYEVGKTGYAYSTIGAAVDAVPSSLAGNTCVVLRDLATYSEQVTVQGKATNGYRLRVLTHPTLGGRAVVNPPAGSTAAFHILNSSVTLESLAVITTNTVAYGVLATSAVATLSDLSVDSGGRIWAAGVQLAGQGGVDASSVTVQSADGLRLTGTKASVTGSSFVAAGGYGIRSSFPTGSAPGLTLTGSTVRNTGGRAVSIEGVGSNLIEGSILEGSGGGLELVSGGSSVVRTSTLSAGGSPGVYLSAAQSTVISRCYVQGSSAAHAAGSDGTVLDSNHLVGQGASGTGVWLTGSSSGLRVSSNTIRAASGGAGVRLDAASAGMLVVSTNTILGGARYGVSVSSPAGGAQLWVTSNTIVAGSSASGDTYGLFLDGLAGGATVQDNGIYHRAAGTMGGFTAFGAFIRSSTGILLKRNRVSHPGVLTAASFEGVRLQGVGAAQVAFGDFHSSGTLVSAYHLRLMGSTASVRNSVFYCGDTVSGSSVAVFADAGSGIASDYNSLYSAAGGSLFRWGPVAYGLGAWTAATGRDAGSIVAVPYWNNVSAGVEDFHPASPRGRYDPVLGTFDFDLWVSSTIDAGDPAEPYGGETGADNTRVNLGSYGNTPEASRSARAPGAVSFFRVYSTSVTLSFGAVGSDGYRAQLDGSQAFTADLSSDSSNPASTALTVDTLAPNTTYYARVGALYNGTFYRFTLAAGSTMTQAAAPVSPQAAAYTSSVSFSWQNGGNPVGTLYAAEVSSDAFATVTAASWTYNTYAVFAGLWPNTTQHLRVRARNGAGTLTAYASDQASTLALPVTGAQVYRVYATSVAVNWTPRPSSPPDASSMTAKGYRVEASTAPDFTGTVLSSQTALVTLSTLTVAGLQNATYYLRVAALNWASAPSYASAGSTRPASTLPPDCPAGFIVRQDGAGDYTTIQAAVSALQPSFLTDACVLVEDGQTYSEQVVVQGKATNGYRLTIMGNRAMTSTGTVIDPPAGSTAAFIVRNASVTITNLMVRPTAAVAYGVYAASAAVAVTTVVVTGASSPWLAAVAASSGALVDRSSVSVGAASGVVFTGTSGQLLRSTVTAYGAAAAAVHLDGARGVAVVDARLSGGQYGALLTGAAGSLLWRSTASAAVGGAALSLSGASSNTVRGCVFVSGGDGAVISAGSQRNVVAASSFVAAGLYGLSIVASSSNTVVDSYLQGNAALDLSGAQATRVGGSRLHSLAAGGYPGLQATGGSGLAVSSSTLSAGDLAAALMVSGMAGQIEVSTNALFGLGPHFDSLAGPVLMTSNTVSVRPQAGTQVWALRLTGLTGGATIQDNGFFFRSAGGGLAYSHYGFDVQASAGVLLQRNRLSQRGMIAAGSFRAVRLLNSTGVRLRHNDVLASGSGLLTAALVDLQSSTAALRNNVFLASFTVTGSSAALTLTADSGVDSDYNDWYSSSAYLGGVWGPQGMPFSSGWFGRDGGSVSLPPLWHDPAGEDFHPRSARGRWDPATLSFATDSQTSPTIDGGDPADGVGLETAPDGGRVNQGSYGGTAEASRSAGPAGAPTLLGVSGSSATVSWTPVSADGYRVDAATSADFAGTLVTSATANGAAAQLSPQALTPNTTYWLRVGALYGAQYEYAPVPGSTATAAHTPAAAAAQTVQYTTASLAWGANGNPVGTRYEAVVSTDLFFGSYASSATLARSATFYDLTANATYYFRVRALGHSGAGAWTTTFSSVTSVAPPAAPVSSVHSSSAALSWGGAGNLVGTLYAAQLSTDGFATVNFTSITAGVTALFGTGGAGPALQADTTFYLRVRGAGHAGPTPYVQASSAATRAADPAGITLTQVGQSSAALSWTSANPAGTRYEAQASTDAFATVSASSQPLSTSATLVGLAGNTTYYLRVRALGHAGPTPFFSAPAATATLVAPPLPLAPSLLAADSFQANWSANGNGASVYYQAQLSTDSFATVNLTSATYNAYAGFSGLLSNTTYYTRVRPVGFRGPDAYVTLPATTTLLLPPAAVADSFPDVGWSSAAVQWASGGNGPGTVYEVQLSSDGFATVNATSATLNTSALFGAGGLGPALRSAAIFAARVRTVAGVNASAYVPLGSTSTLAFMPVTPLVSAVSSASVTLAWSVGTNGPAAVYRSEASTDSFATINAATVTYAGAATLWGLQPNTTQQLRVRAADPYGRVTAYVLTVPSATAAAAPLTLAAAVRVSSLTAAWSVNGNPAGTLFDARLSTDAFATVSAASGTYSASALFGTGGHGPALRANTTYYLSVRALGHGGSYTAAASSAAVTPAAAPGAAALGGVWLSSASFSWTSGGNPAGTLYEAQVSTDAFATVSDSSRTLSAGATFFALTANATYYLRARAIGHDGAARAFSTGATTVTAAAVPASAPPLSVQASSVTAAWGANGNAADTLYQAQVSTDAFATVSAASATRNAFAAFLGLQANTTHYFRVRAVGRSGAATAFASLPSTTTLLLSPAAAGAAFPSVGVTSVTAQWASGGNGPGTLYEAQLSSDAFASVHATSATYALTAAFGAGGAGSPLLGAATYYARVRAVSGGNASSYLPLGATETRADLPLTPLAAQTSTSSLILAWGGGGNGPRTVYRAEASLDGFASVAAASVTFNSSALLSGLQPDTTYQTRVRALAPSGAGSAYALAAASATFAAAPSSPTASFALSSAALSWSASGNPAGTRFELRLSTDAFATLNVSTRTTAVSAGLTGLRANTTYYAAVRALGHGGAFTAAASTAGVTAAAAPVSAALGLVALTSASWSWSAAGNPAGTLYEAQASTDAFATLAASSRTLAAGATFFALASNTTYYFRVRALGHAGAATSFAVAAASVTRAADPAALQPSSVSATGVVAAWSANGNGPGTLYQARLSTDSFATVNGSSATRNAWAAFSGLQSNTTYYFQVRAVAHDGSATAFVTLPATTTLLLPPGLPAQPFASVQSASMTTQWTSGGNGAGTRYQAQLSTDAFATVSVDSVTFNLFARFGTGGAGPALLLNTTYHARARAVSATNASAWLTLGSSATPAAAPASAALISVASTVVSIDWQPNGNPEPGTVYELWRDGTGAFPSPEMTRLSTTAAVVTALGAGATYYFKVRALGHNGAYTAFSATLSTATLPPAPGPTGALSGAALGVSSITWSWTAAPLAVGYRLYRASAPAVLAGTVGAAPFALTGLATNTAYGLMVAGYNASGDGPLSAATTVYTLARPPSGSAASQVQGTSATVSWSLNTNPVQTSAEIQRSTDNAAFAVVAVASVTAYTDTNLIGCTTYYFRVRNRSGGGVATAFDSTVQLRTLASTPAAAGGLSAESLAGGRIALSWTASPTEGVTGYRLYGDGGTGAVNYAAPLAVLTSTETAFTTGVLVSSAAYRFALRARHRCGVEEAAGVLAQAAASVTLPNARAAVRGPSAGKRLAGNRVTVAAELTAGPAQSVRFEYKASSDPASGWTAIPTVTAGQANPDTGAPYFIHWDVSGLTATSYDLRAVARDLAGTPDPAPPAVSVSVYPADPDSTETLVSGRVRKELKVSNGAASDIRGSDTGQSAARVVLPAGALSASSATATLVVGAALPAAPPDGATDAGLSLDISLSNGQTALLADATLEFHYPDGDGDGVVDGTGVRAEDLKIFTYDAAAGGWKLEGNTVVDSANKRVLGTTPHFSVFAAFPQAASVNLDRVRVYPVPYVPYGPDPDEGRPFVAGDLTTGIIFDNLPAAVTIKIYTLTGGLVAEFSSNAGTGRLQWDARNRDGRMAASGGYFAVITSPGQKSVVKRLSIIR